MRQASLFRRRRLQKRLRGQSSRHGAAEEKDLSMAGQDKSDLDKMVEEMQTSIINDARETFSEEVVNRWLNPRNIGRMENPDGVCSIRGPCGDTMEIFLRVRDGRIANATFMTDGCGTSIAAGSMATDLAIGKTVEKVLKVSKEVILDELGGLPEESEHCALLASNTLREAIKDYLTCEKDPWKRSYRT